MRDITHTRANKKTDVEHSMPHKMLAQSFCVFKNISNYYTMTNVFAYSFPQNVL